MKRKAMWATMALGGVSALLLASCASFRQQPDQAWVRAPGERMLGSFTPVETKAREHWPYAWLSEAAYQDSQADDEPGTAPCAMTPRRILQASGWSRWSDFPNGALAAELKNAHLRAEVWYNRERNTLAIAFGGTVFDSGKDWLSNLRWFVPGDRNDEYTALVRRFIPALRDKFIELKGQPDNAALSSATLVSTGHSLGGGLAQQFAYALDPDDRLPRVSTVYAFNPSPVTGYYSVDDAVRDANSRNLKIERIYERGEILASLRSVLRVFYPLSASNPAISEVRYNLFWKPQAITVGGAVRQHSMAPFASGLAKAAGTEAQGTAQAVALTTQCAAKVDKVAAS